MKKLWIVLAVVIVGALLVFFFFQNRDVQPSSDISEEPKKLAQSEKQVQEIDGVELSGKVIDGLTKAPLAAKINVKSENQIIATTKCNANGEFVVSLKDGNYEIAVEYPHYVTKGKYDENRLVEIDGEPVRIDDTELWPEAIVKGRVVSENQGIEAELQFIYQNDNSDAKHYLFKTIKTDRNGYFTLDKAYGGVQNIRVSADNLVSQKLSDVVLTPGETVDLGEIPMKSGLTIFGVVNAEDTKKGISGASVLCVDTNRVIVAKSFTSEDGSYTLPVVDLEKLRIIITADGFHSNSILLDPQSQNRYEYNVSLTKLEEKKVAQNAVTQPSDNVNNNEPQEKETDESGNEFTEEEVLQYKNDLKNVVKNNSKQLAECYENLLAIEKLSGRIVFNFLSTSSGDVFDIKINETEIHNEEFLDCLTDMIANFHLPKRTNDAIASIEYPFEFSSED